MPLPTSKVFTLDSTGLIMNPDYSFPTGYTKRGGMTSINICRADDDGKLIIGFDDGITSSKDEKVLLDQVVTYLLNSKLTSYFNNQLGSYLSQLKYYTTMDPVEIRAKITLIIEGIASQIKIDQQQNINLTDRQLLKSLTVNSIYQDPVNKDRILVEVYVTTESDETYILTV